MNDAALSPREVFQVAVLAQLPTWLKPQTDPVSIRSEDGWGTQCAGMQHWQQQRLYSAVQAFETANTFVPLHFACQLALADCYLDLGHRSLAKIMLQHVCRLPACPVSMLRTLAAELGRRHEYRLALLVCKILAKREPTCPHAQFGIAFYLDRLQVAPTFLLPFLQQAYRLVPTCWLARLNLATVLGRLERWPEAYELLAELPWQRLTQPLWLRRIRWIAIECHDWHWARQIRTHLQQLPPSAGVDAEQAQAFSWPEFDPA